MCDEMEERRSRAEERKEVEAMMMYMYLFQYRDNVFPGILTETLLLAFTG